MTGKTQAGQPSVLDSYTQNIPQPEEQSTNTNGIAIDLSEVSKFYETERNKEYSAVMSSIKSLLSTGRISPAALQSRAESLSSRITTNQYAIASAKLAAAAGIQGANEVLVEATKANNTSLYILNMYATNPEKALIADMIDIHKELAPSIQAHAGLITTAGLGKAEALSGIGQYNTGSANARSIAAQTEAVENGGGMTVADLTSYMNSLISFMKTDTYNKLPDEDKKKVINKFNDVSNSLGVSSSTTAPKVL